MAKSLRTDPASLAQMRRNLDTIADPVEFCRRYLRTRGFHRHRDIDDVLEVAVESLVKAGLTWSDDDGGVAFTTWAYRYMDREVFRELARDRRRMETFGAKDCESQRIDDRWLAYADGTRDYRRIEDRVVLGDLCERAQLSDRHRLVLAVYALHGGSNGPPPAGQPAVGRIAGSSDYRKAISRVRRAAREGGVVDDEWARARQRRDETVA